MIAALFAFLFARDRDEMLAEEMDRAQIHAVLLAEHATRLFESAELALATVIDDTRGMDLANLRDSPRLHRRLVQLAERLPYVEAFWLHDAQGRLRLTSLAHPPLPADASKLDFFVTHRENAGSGVHVGDLVSGTFRLSRRIEDDTGTFRGAASLSVETSFFRMFYHQVPLPQGSTVTLVRAPDLVPLIQQPQRKAGPMLHDARPLREAIAENPSEGLFRSVSAEDRLERIFAYRKVSSFPLYVKVSVPLAGCREAWMDRVLLRLTGAGAAVLVLGLLTLLALREADRQRFFQNTLEERVTARTGELAKAVQEVHHRVRNNLQIVGTLLTMQAARVGDPEIRAALSESIGRVHTISLVHQTMYGAGAVAELPFGTYLRDLALQIGDLYGGAPLDIQVTGANPALPLETAVPLGLIVHEALSNAMKHAFPHGRSGHVAIDFAATDWGWRLTIADDGTGLADPHPEGLGLRIMRSLATQVGAKLAVEADHGTRVKVDLGARW